MYEYKFIEVPFDKFFGVKKGGYFDKCKEIINEQAKNGWRLKQVVIPANEKTGIAVPYAYQIIFENEVKQIDYILILFEFIKYIK